MKSFKDTPTFPASDWFDLAFIGTYVHSDNNLKKELNTKKYRIRDNIISSRVLNHWYSLGIINDDRPDSKGWKKFSFSEILWIRIVLRLRDFGLELSRIKKVKECLNEYNKLDSNSECLLLDFFAFVALYSEIPIRLLVYKTGFCHIARKVDFEMAEILMPLEGDYLVIDFNNLLREILAGELDKDIWKDIEVDDTLLKLIQNSLNDENIQSVSIRVKKDGFIVDEEYCINEKRQALVFMNLLKYGRMIERKIDGKSQYYVTKTSKIKKEK